MVGTDLFSNEETLMEKLGEYEFNQEICKYSKFYIDELLNKKSTDRTGLINFYMK